MVLLQLYLFGMFVVLLEIKVQNYYFSDTHTDYTPFRAAFIVSLFSWVTVALLILVLVIMPIFEIIAMALRKAVESIKRDCGKLAMSNIAQNFIQWFERTPHDPKGSYKNRLKEKEV